MPVRSPKSKIPLLPEGETPIKSVEIAGGGFAQLSYNPESYEFHMRLPDGVKVAWEKELPAFMTECGWKYHRKRALYAKPLGREEFEPAKRAVITFFETVTDPALQTGRERS